MQCHIGFGNVGRSVASSRAGRWDVLKAAVVLQQSPTRKLSRQRHATSATPWGKYFGPAAIGKILSEEEILSVGASQDASPASLLAYVYTLVA